MSSEVHVRLAGGYYFRQLTRIVRDLQPLMSLREPADVRVDMSALTFMGPAAMALTLATLSRVWSGLTKTSSELILPAAPGIRNYLHRMDFFRLLFGGAELFTSYEPTRHETRGFRECRHFVTNDEADVVARDLANALEEKVMTDRMARISLAFCLTELAENVHYHADTPLGGFAAAQAMTKTNEIEMAIADLGQGIASSLSKNPRYAPRISSDLDAIRIAMRPTVTATPGRNSGHGLAFTQLLLRLNDGRLVVRSGHGHLQVGDRMIEKTETDALPGTLVGLRLRTDRPFDFRRAYDLLEREIDRIVRTDPSIRDPRDDN